jgi:lincosamide nucleotidyltransferase A/C/D/E
MPDPPGNRQPILCCQGSAHGTYRWCCSGRLFGVVNIDDVLELLHTFEYGGVRCWLDGGWGVDALLGRQTRDHADLDLALDAAHLATAERLLTARGFTIQRNWLPTALALRDAEGREGREVDLHPLETTADSGGDQILEDGARYHYGPPVLGRIGGRTVPCCSAEQQAEMHLGYAPRDKDQVDMTLLASELGVALPPPYGGG